MNKIIIYNHIFNFIYITIYTVIIVAILNSIVISEGYGWTQSQCQIYNTTIHKNVLSAKIKTIYTSGCAPDNIILYKSDNQTLLENLDKSYNNIIETCWLSNWVTLYSSCEYFLNMPNASNYIYTNIICILNNILNSSPLNSSIIYPRAKSLVNKNI